MPIIFVLVGIPSYARNDNVEEPLRPLSLSHQLFQQHVHEREDNRADQRREKRGDEEPAHEARSNLEDDGIDHEPEQAKRQDGEWKREDLEYQAERRVEKAEDQRGNQRRTNSHHVEAGDDVGDD